MANLIEFDHLAALKRLEPQERIQLINSVGYACVEELCGPFWWREFPDEFDDKGCSKMGGFKDAFESGMKQMTAGPGPMVGKNGIKVTEHKVEKVVGPAKEQVPAPKAALIRWVNGHKLTISQDGFCNIKCEQCGITSVTYLTPYDKQCEKPATTEYDWYC